MTTPKTYETSQILTTNQNAAMRTIQTPPINKHYFIKVQIGNCQEKAQSESNSRSTIKYLHTYLYST